MQGKIDVVIVHWPSILWVDTDLVPPLIVHMTGDNVRAIFEGQYKAVVYLLDEDGRYVGNRLVGEGSRIVEGVPISGRRTVAFTWQHLQISEEGEDYRFAVRVWEVGVHPGLDRLYMGSDESGCFIVGPRCVPMVTAERSSNGDIHLTIV